MEQQRTPEWFANRLGHLTASRIKDAIDTLKNGGESEKRKTYRLELVAERLTGLPTEFYETAAMRFGTENEPFARSAYEAHRGAFVVETGFVKHPSLEWAGASPDGLIHHDGLLEIKCPNTTTHVRWLLDGVVPDQHKPQMLWQMACTDRSWCDFVSYDPRMPEELQLFVVRFEPEESAIKEIEEKAQDFLLTVDSYIQRLEVIGTELIKTETYKGSEP